MSKVICLVIFSKSVAVKQKLELFVSLHLSMKEHVYKWSLKKLISHFWVSFRKVISDMIIFCNKHGRWIEVLVKVCLRIWEIALWSFSINEENMIRRMHLSTHEMLFQTHFINDLLFSLSYYELEMILNILMKLKKKRF